jgi:hypothetical protein
VVVVGLIIVADLFKLDGVFVVAELGRGKFTVLGGWTGVDPVPDCVHAETSHITQPTTTKPHPTNSFLNLTIFRTSPPYFIINQRL